MNLQTNGRMQVTAKGDVASNNTVNLTFSLGKGFHVAVLKTLIPLLLLITLCACVLHWVGVI